MAYEDRSRILLQVADGDQRAFSALIDVYTARLVAYAKTIVKTKALAEEVVADVFINLWKGRHILPSVSNIAYYLFTACKNTALNQLKKEARHRVIDVEGFNEYLPDYTDNFATIENKEKVLEALSILQQLPPKCQLIFRLSKEDGFTYSEIAQLLNLSVKTVENQMTIAFKKITATRLLHLAQQKQGS